MAIEHCVDLADLRALAGDEAEFSHGFAEERSNMLLAVRDTDPRRDLSPAERGKLAGFFDVSIAHDALLFTRDACCNRAVKANCGTLQRPQMLFGSSLIARMRINLASKCAAFKNGAPSVHPIGGEETRALRRLKRDEPPSATAYQIWTNEYTASHFTRSRRSSSAIITRSAGKSGGRRGGISVKRAPQKALILLGCGLDEIGRGYVVVFGERHLRHLRGSYQRYYNEVRTHLSRKQRCTSVACCSGRWPHRGRPTSRGLQNQYVRI